VGANNLSIGDQNTERKTITDSDTSQIMMTFLFRHIKREKRMAGMLNRHTGIPCKSFGNPLRHFPIVEPKLIPFGGLDVISNSIHHR